jgi:hypothetical protein
LLLFLNIAQLLLYIGGLGLAGQGLLYVLAGEGRHTNLFYQLIGMVNKPACNAPSIVANFICNPVASA